MVDDDILSWLASEPLAGPRRAHPGVEPRGSRPVPLGHRCSDIEHDWRMPIGDTAISPLPPRNVHDQRDRTHHWHTDTDCCEDAPVWVFPVRSVAARASFEYLRSTVRAASVVSNRGTHRVCGDCFSSGSRRYFGRSGAGGFPGAPSVIVTLHVWKRISSWGNDDNVYRQTARTCALLCDTMSMTEWGLSVTSDTHSYVGAHLPKSKNTNRLSESF